MSNISSICHLLQLHTIKKEWDEIHGNSALKSPFLSHEFLIHWYNCFAEPDQVRIYRVSDRGQTIGFLPLVLYRKNHIRVLSSLTNDHCFHSSPLVLRGYEPIFSELILKELLKDRDNWDVFRHSFSYSFSQILGLFSDDLLNNTSTSWFRYTQPTYTVFLNKSFEEYFRTDLNPNTRKNFMRYKNRLARTGSHTLGHYQGPEALKRWPEFVRIENSGWKGNAGSSIKSINANYQRYYKELVNILADTKAFNIYFLELNGKAIAGVFGYFEGDTFHWWKTGYDEQYKKLSPSNLLLIYIIEHLITNFPMIKRFHMFPWDHGYKHRFVNEDSFCTKTILFSNTLRGKSARLLFTMKKKLKTLLKNQSEGI